MATKLRSEIKANFQTGLIPVESHYTDLIDSALNISESNTGRINLVGDVSMSGNISASGASSTHTLGGTILDIKGNVTSSGAISSSGLITGKDAEIFGNITASGNIKGGNFVVGGSLTATSADYTHLTASIFSASSNIITSNITASGNISASGTILADQVNIDGKLSLNTDGTTGRVFSDGISAITGIQIGRQGTSNKNIELLGPVTASAGITSSIINCTSLNTGQGNNELFVMDQNVNTTAAVSFASIRLTKTGLSAGNFGETIVTEGQSFTITINSIPEIPGKDDLGKVAKTINNAIQNDSIRSDSVILISSTADLSATAFRVANGSCLFSITNESPSTFADGTAQFNFTIF